MTDPAPTRMVSVPTTQEVLLMVAEYLDSDLKLMGNSHAAFDRRMNAVQALKTLDPTHLRHLAALTPPAPIAAPAQAEAELRAEAKLLAEIAYHRRMAAKYMENEDAWYAHICLQEVVADKLSLIRREAHWQDKLAQALAPAEGTE